ncbi:hypothetical protein [Lolliginicoccus suaedae]|uniref:hypothetical protein n=1 Tax=Lolliginicoccus suaedae TaxID=2605429 RepID=UPI0011EFE0FB|nr:hypothetical protein [Lolliginicoccus suaedae]
MSLSDELARRRAGYMPRVDLATFSLAAELRAATPEDFDRELHAFLADPEVPPNAKQAVIADVLAVAGEVDKALARVAVVLGRRESWKTTLAARERAEVDKANAVPRLAAAVDTARGRLDAELARVTAVAAAVGLDLARIDTTPTTRRCPLDDLRHHVHAAEDAVRAAGGEPGEWSDPTVGVFELAATDAAWASRFPAVLRGRTRVWVGPSGTLPEIAAWLAAEAPR